MLEGLAVTERDGSIVQCTATDSGTARCSCNSSANGSTRFELDAEANSEATCEFAFTLCTADIQPLADAEDSCEPIPTEVEDESASYPGSACFGGLSCLRPGTASGTEILVEGSIYATCEPYDTSYRCRCGGSDVFALDAADLHSACDAAVTRCPDLDEPTYRTGIYRD
jgi:hypothetical protein